MKRITSLLLAMVMLVALAATPTLAQEIKNSGEVPKAVEQLSKELADSISSEVIESVEESAADLAEKVGSTTQNADKNAPLLKFSELRKQMMAHNPTLDALASQMSDLNAMDSDTMKAGLSTMKAYSSQLAALGKRMNGAQRTAESEGSETPMTGELAFIYECLATLIGANALSLEMQIKNAESQIESMEVSQETGSNSINDGMNQLIKGAEALYIGIVTMEAALGDVQRGIDSLDRAVAIYEKQYELGMASAYDVESMKHQRSSVLSQLESLKFQIETSKITLESMCGLELNGNVRLEALTMPTPKELAAVNYEKDLSAAMNRNVSVMNARAEYWHYGGNSYDYAVEAAEADFTYAFKIVCMTVGEKQRLVEAAQETVDFQQRTFEIEAKEYELGMISYEEYMTAKNNLEQAKSDLNTAKLELFTAYRNYIWGKDYGIV